MDAPLETLYSGALISLYFQVFMLSFLFSTLDKSSAIFLVQSRRSICTIFIRSIPSAKVGRQYLKIQSSLRQCLSLVLCIIYVFGSVGNLFRPISNPDLPTNDEWTEIKREYSFHCSQFVQLSIFQPNITDDSLLTFRPNRKF